MTYTQAKTRIMQPDAYTHAQRMDAALAILAHPRAPAHDVVAAQNVLASACGYAHIAPEPWHSRDWRV